MSTASLEDGTHAAKLFSLMSSFFLSLPHHGVPQHFPDHWLWLPLCNQSLALHCFQSGNIFISKKYFPVFLSFPFHDRLVLLLITWDISNLSEDVQISSMFFPFLLDSLDPAAKILLCFALLIHHHSLSLKCLVTRDSCLWTWSYLGIFLIFEPLFHNFF